MKISKLTSVLTLAAAVLIGLVTSDVRAQRWSIELQRLNVVDRQESSGDEPYVAVIGFRSTFGRAGSTQTFWNRSLSKIGDNMKEGASASISTAMGRVDFGTITQGTALEIFGVVMVALEKDRTPWGTIHAMFDDAERALRIELRRLVESDTLDILAPQAQIRAATQRVEAAVRPSILNAIGIWLSSLTDPDDIISVQPLIIPVLQNLTVPGMFPFVETPFVTTFSNSNTTWRVDGRTIEQDEPWTGAGHRGYGWTVGDFNGDGKDDIFRQVNQWGGAEVLLSDGSEFDYAGRWTGAGHRGYGWTVGDFNGDGKDDIFRQIDQWGGAEVFLSTGSSFVYNGQWVLNGARGYGWTVGDFNGDGKDDIFRQINQWGGAEVFLSNGARFVYAGQWTPNGHRGHGWTVGDFNGDGKDDIFRQVNEWGGAEVFLSLGNRFALSGQWTGAGHRGHGWAVGDFNGDGKADVFRQINQWGGAEVLTSSGAGFTYRGQWIANGHRGHGWIVGDFNGDGKDDISRQVNEWGGAEVFRSWGGGFAANYN